MTKEEKQLLLKDICARLPYGVMVHATIDGDNALLGVYNDRVFTACEDPGKHNDYPSDCIKPYLRPLSSMTEEEGKELEHIFCEIDAPCWVDTTYGCVTFASDNDFISAEIAEVYTDWLNKKMFDYRGLIEKGLAIEAPEGMYKTE